VVESKSHFHEVAFVGSFVLCVHRFLVVEVVVVEEEGLRSWLDCIQINDVMKSVMTR